MRGFALPAPIGAGIGLGLVGVAVLAIGAAWVYRNRALFNPASERNLANQAASGLVEQLTGGADAGGESSVGGVLARIREWASGDDARIREMLKGSTPAPHPAEAGADSWWMGAP